MDPLPLQEEDQCIGRHNGHLEGRGDMVAYRDGVRNGSLNATLGPPVYPLKQVPQTRYTGNRNPNSDTAHFFEQLCPIEFRVELAGGGGEQGEFNGLKLIDAVHNKTTELRGRDDILWLNDHMKTSIRLKVNNEEDYGEQKSSRRSTFKQEPLSRAKIAGMVATVVQNCMERTGGQWHLPNGDTVKFEDLLLLELRHVSRGSWQPVLAYFDLSFR